LVGIALSRLEPTGREQQEELLPSADPTIETDRDRTLSRTMDRIEAKFGRGAVGPARVTAEAHRDRDRFTP
ncbi:MAG: hypothetical protein ABI647_22080, partial [Gemmatimonadota bacterium]